MGLSPLATRKTSRSPPTRTAGRCVAGGKHRHAISGGQAGPGPAPPASPSRRAAGNPRLGRNLATAGRFVAPTARLAHDAHRPDGKNDIQRRVPGFAPRAAGISCGLRAMQPRIAAQGTDCRGDGALAAVSFLPRITAVKKDAAMPLHLLGIARHDVAAGGSLEVPPELHRHGVCWVAQEDVAAAVMPSSHSPLAPLDHARLLETIHCRMDILPVRYGVEMPDKRAVRDLLRERRSELLASLRRLEGDGRNGAADRACSRRRTALRCRRDGSLRCAAEFTPLLPGLAPSTIRAEQPLGVDGPAGGRPLPRSPGRSGGRLPAARIPAARHRAAGLSGRAVPLGVLPASAELLFTRASDHTCTLLGPWPPYSFV